MIFFSFNNGFYGKKKNQEGLANNFISISYVTFVSF
jgi:hypothetical protein